MCVMGQHLSSGVDLLSLNKPSTRKAIKKGTSPRPHTAQQQCQGGISLFPHREKTAAVPRGKRENISQGTLWVQCDRAVCAIRTGTGAAIHGQADPALVFPPGTSEPPAKPTAGSAAVRAQ